MICTDFTGYFRKVESDKCRNSYKEVVLRFLTRLACSTILRTWTWLSSLVCAGSLREVCGFDFSFSVSSGHRQDGYAGPSLCQFRQDFLCQHVQRARQRFVHENKELSSVTSTSGSKNASAIVCEIITVATNVVSGAADLKDNLCLEAFYKAGEHLGRHVAALASRIEKVQNIRLPQREPNFRTPRWNRSLKTESDSLVGFTQVYSKGRACVKTNQAVPFCLEAAVSFGALVKSKCLI